MAPAAVWAPLRVARPAGPGVVGVDRGGVVSAPLTAGVSPLRMGLVPGVLALSWTGPIMPHYPHVCQMRSRN